MKSSVPIVYQDEQLIVVEKPTRLLAVPGRGADKQDCAVARLQRTHADALVVHRLDRDTSGLMLFARSADVHRQLSRQFELRQVSKRYEAIVEGHVKLDAGEIRLPLRKCLDRPPRHRVDFMQGKPAITRWERMEAVGSHTRIVLRPLTGRSHQLRVHMQQLIDQGGRHPIVGDPLYGSRGEDETHERLMLHATRLGIEHPTTGKPIVWESLCPF